MTGARLLITSDSSRAYVGDPEGLTLALLMYPDGSGAVAIFDTERNMLGEVPLDLTGFRALSEAILSQLPAAYAAQLRRAGGIERTIGGPQ